MELKLPTWMFRASAYFAERTKTTRNEYVRAALARHLRAQLDLLRDESPRQYAVMVGSLFSPGGLGEDMREQDPRCYHVLTRDLGDVSDQSQP